MILALSMRHWPPPLATIPRLSRICVSLLESASRQIDLLGRARCDANWHLAAWRLKGLAASFGLTSLMALAEEAAQSAPGDPKILRRLQATLDTLARD